MSKTAMDSMASDAVSIFAAIVLYNTAPSDSESFQTLQAAACRVPPDKLRLNILLYDNTPGGLCVGVFPEGIRYESASHNPGLSVAYNRALEIAEAEGFDWILTLDQDTSLPDNYLLKICDIVNRRLLDASIAAIVPQITDNGRVLSPSWWHWGFIPRCYPPGFIGIPKHVSHAFNSAATLRVSSIRKIGGYDPRFWLDCSDTYLYHQLHHHEMKMYVAGDIQVKHQLSVLDMNQRVSLARYQNILDAGCAFWDIALGQLAGLDYTARLAYRIVYKHAKHGHNSAFRRASWEMLKRRIFQSRRRRLKDWNRRMENRGAYLKQNCASGEVNARLRISVCMATYNGERYIASQLRSILGQLSDEDEVVVVDDASCDKTVSIVEGLCDKRIRVIRHSSNSGVVASFEKAILESRGDIIFLSDQDDLWKPGKVSRIMQAFNDPKVTLAQSDAQIIDAAGNIIARSYSQTRGGFVPGVMQNVLRCRYLGCTMAFRRDILAYCLPFPKDIPMHDVWIGIVNVCFGRTTYVPEPLVEYRRHEDNVSRKGSRIQQIRWRLNLLSNIVKLRFRTG